MTDYANTARLVLDIVQMVGIVILTIYTWASNRHKANKDAIDHVDARVDTLSDRVLKAEAAVKHMPDHETLQRVHDRIDDAAEGIAKLNGQTEQMNMTLRLIQQTLLKGGG